MATLGLRFYLTFPLTLGNLVDPVDVFIGDGVTTTFALVNNTATIVGDLVEVAGTVYSRGAGGWSLSGNSVVFPSAPANGAIIVVTGVSYLNFQSTDVAGTNVSVKGVYLADADAISGFTYVGTPPAAGPQIFPYNNIAGVGAQANWFQLSMQDGSGNPLGYTAAGGTLTLPVIQNKDILQSANSGSNITVATGSNFTAGWLLSVNPGQSNAEIVTIMSIAVNVLTTSGFNFAHLSGEPVFHCGYPLLVQCTVPNNATGHVAANLPNVSLRRQWRAQARF